MVVFRHARGLFLALMATSLAACAASREPGAPVYLHELEPTLRHRTLTERFDIYVMKREKGGYATKVCVRYRETGSHIWRNSCRNNVTRSISLLNPLQLGQYSLGSVGQNPPVHTNATPELMALRLEAAFNVALNGDVEIRDLTEGEIIELKKELPEGIEAPEAATDG